MCDKKNVCSVVSDNICSVRLSEQLLYKFNVRSFVRQHCFERTNERTNYMIVFCLYVSFGNYFVFIFSNLKIPRHIINRNDTFIVITTLIERCCERRKWKIRIQINVMYELSVKRVNFDLLGETYESMFWEKKRWISRLIHLLRSLYLQCLLLRSQNMFMLNTAKLAIPFLKFMNFHF